MRIEDLSQPLRPWMDAFKIPWNDPEFSRRMLREHLSQEHDLASRRTEKIELACKWIHEVVLERKPSSILDLGCGPGLYANRLASMGHDVHGIDFSPASIEYANENRVEGARFALADVRSAELEGPYHLAMMLFGEANTFPVEEVQAIVRRAADAVDNGGALLWEVSVPDGIRSGSRPQAWRYLSQGLFCPQPHLLLDSAVWHEEQSTLLEEYLVVSDGGVERFAQCTRATALEEWDTWFADVGLPVVSRGPSFGGDGLATLLAQPKA